MFLNRRLNIDLNTVNESQAGQPNTRTRGCIGRKICSLACMYPVPCVCGKDRKKERKKGKERTWLRGISCSRQAERLTVEMLRAFLLLLHLQYLTSCDQQRYLLALCPVPAGVRYPALNGLSQPANHKCLASPTCCSGTPQSLVPQVQTNSAWGSLVGWERGGSMLPLHPQAWGTS